MGSLQNAISASADRPAFYVIGIILLFGVFLGRVICGFLCPFGLIQELLYEIPVKKLKKNKITQKLTLIKYVKKGKLFIFGGCLIALGAVMPVMEMLMNYTFQRKFVAWSVYPFAALVGVGLYLIFLGIYRPAREIMERKFFI